MEKINIATPVCFGIPALPPFDIKKAIYDASTIGGTIYVHPFLFDSIYRYTTENIDKPFNIDPHGSYDGKIKIVVTDLLPENGYRVMTEIEFGKEFENGKQTTSIYFTNARR